MTQLGQEIKKTFSQFKGAFASETKKSEIDTPFETPMSTATATIPSEKEEKFRKTFNKSENDVTGRIISSVSQQQKPARSIYINESDSIRFMDMKEKDDAYIAIDEIRNEQVIALVLENLDVNSSRTILDIIYGACHYANIVVEQVSPRMLLIDPKFKN